MDKPKKIEPQDIKWLKLGKQTSPEEYVHSLVLLLMGESGKPDTYVLLAEPSFFYHPIEEKSLLRGFLIREGVEESFCFLEITPNILAWAPINRYSPQYPRY